MYKVNVTAHHADCDRVATIQHILIPKQMGHEQQSVHVPWVRVLSLSDPSIHPSLLHMQTVLHIAPFT